MIQFSHTHGTSVYIVIKWINKFQINLLKLKIYSICVRSRKMNKNKSFLDTYIFVCIYIDRVCAVQLDTCEVNTRTHCKYSLYSLYIQEYNIFVGCSFHFRVTQSQKIILNKWIGVGFCWIIYFNLYIKVYCNLALFVLSIWYLIYHYLWFWLKLKFLYRLLYDQNYY